MTPTDAARIRAIFAREIEAAEGDYETSTFIDWLTNLRDEILQTHDPLTDVSEASRKRFWRRIDTAGECWLFTGSLDDRGYGRLQINHRSYGAHRVAYTWTKGPIPAGLVLDHLCRNPTCVNPDHLEPVTQFVNTMRGTAARTHCKNGHEYTEDNIRWSVRPGRRPFRLCRECRKAYAREGYARKRSRTTT